MVISVSAQLMPASCTAQYFVTVLESTLPTDVVIALRVHATLRGQRNAVNYRPRCRGSGGCRLRCRGSGGCRLLFRHDAPGTNEHGRALDTTHRTLRIQITEGVAFNDPEVHGEGHFFYQGTTYVTGVRETCVFRFRIGVVGVQVIAVVARNVAGDDGDGLLSGDGV